MDVPGTHKTVKFRPTTHFTSVCYAVWPGNCEQTSKQQTSRSRSHVRNSLPPCVESDNNSNNDNNNNIGFI